MKKYPLKEVIMSLIINILTLGISGFVYRGTHKQMCIQENREVVYCSFDSFKKIFQKASFSYNKNWPNSLFGESKGLWDKNYIHADIMRINGVGLILSTWGFIKVKKIIKRKCVELSGIDNFQSI